MKKKKGGKKKGFSIKKLLDTKRVVSIIVLLLFIGSIVVAFAPTIFYGFFVRMKPLSETPVINLDTGEEALFQKFSSRNMLVIIFDNTRGDDYKKLVDMISDLKNYIEGRGLRIIFILSGGDKESLINYLTQEHPYLFNSLTWLHDKDGLFKDKLGADLSRARIYYVTNIDWSYKYIGDSDIQESALIFKIDKIVRSL